MRGDGVPWRRRWVAGAVGVRGLAVGVLALGVLAVGVLALGGCTGGGQPEPSASVSPSPSPTASPSPSETPVVAPVRPPEMERSDEVGAVAAARYFMELYAFTFATGDLTEWDAVSGQTCGFCDNVRTDVTRVYDAGGRYVGGMLESLEDVRVVGVDEQLVVFGVQVRHAYSEGLELDAAGEVVDEFPRDEGYVVLDVAPSVRGWILMGGAAQDGAIE